MNQRSKIVIVEEFLNGSASIFYPPSNPQQMDLHPLAQGSCPFSLH